MTVSSTCHLRLNAPDPPVLSASVLKQSRKPNPPSSRWLDKCAGPARIYIIRMIKGTRLLLHLNGFAPPALAHEERPADHPVSGRSLALSLALKVDVL